MPQKNSPIGVFDSGIGGLTVLSALRRKFPHESYVYLGDTARLPYGTKSPETVRRYSESLCRALLDYDPKAIVIACNTASTHALDAVRMLANPLPVIGMIEPAAQAAVKATRNRHIAIIGTFGTVRSDAYGKAIATLAPDIRVISRPCQILVALAEEGWTTNQVAKSTLEEYLSPIFTGDSPDTLILGCTHFPVFANLIRDIVGSDVVLINSGEAAAETMAGILQSDSRFGTLSFLATDAPERFADMAGRFFDLPLGTADIRQIDVTS